MSVLAHKIRNRRRMAYVLTDLLTTSVAVMLFNVTRGLIDDRFDYNAWNFLYSNHVILGQVVFTLLMMGIYWLSGYYNDVNSRSRAQEFVNTGASALTGSLTIFLLAVVNDQPKTTSLAWEQIGLLFLLLFLLVYIGRYLLTRIAVREVHSRRRSELALVIGTDRAAIDLAQRINSLRKGSGMTVSALVSISPDNIPGKGADQFACLNLSELNDYADNHAFVHAIISPSLNHQPEVLSRVLAQLLPLDIGVYVVPELDMAHLTSHRVYDVMGEPLINISRANISPLSANVKRTIDVIISSVALLLCAPVFAWIALKIKRFDGGPVFFRQERMGYRNRPFRIIKFRTMEVSNRPEPPLLTCDDDPRVTRPGRFLRKYRLDELPQFVNVLKGEMSLVGPRPEQSFYAAQIAARVPNYHKIYQVRPGITSWGMVRYGYASTVDEMLERLRYDMIYLENISLITDLKILLHTINTVISGHGK